jgi:hypothetical protein
VSTHKTNVFEDFILNHFRGGTAWTQPISLEVALFTAVADADAGSVTEVPTTGGHYARQTLTLGVPATGAAGMRAANTADLTFPRNTSGASIGSVSHWGVYDNSANLLTIAPFGGTAFVYGDDFQPEIATGSLGVELQGMTNHLATLVLNHLRGGTAWTQPATIEGALLTAVSDIYAGVVTEVATGSGYARPAVTFGAPVAGTSGRRITNDVTENFGLNTGVNLGTVSHFGFHDGTDWAYLFPFSSAWDYVNGLNPQFDPGTLAIEER